VAHDMTEQTAFAAPPPDPELRRLEPLLGTWQAEDRTLDSVLGPGVPVASAESFQWLEGGYFMVQTYETSFGAHTEGNQLLVLRLQREAVPDHLLQQQRLVHRGGQPLSGRGHRADAHLRGSGAVSVRAG
jgi:hypothetical protein